MFWSSQSTSFKTNTNILTKNTRKNNSSIIFRKGGKQVKMVLYLFPNQLHSVLFKE